MKRLALALLAPIFALTVVVVAPLPAMAATTWQPLGSLSGRHRRGSAAGRGRRRRQHRLRLATQRRDDQLLRRPLLPNPDPLPLGGRRPEPDPNPFGFGTARCSPAGRGRCARQRGVRLAAPRRDEPTNPDSGSLGGRRPQPDADPLRRGPGRGVSAGGGGRERQRGLCLGGLRRGSRADPGPHPLGGGHARVDPDPLRRGPGRTVPAGRSRPERQRRLCLGAMLLRRD